MKLSPGDAAVSTITLVFSLLLLYLFIQETNRVTVRRNETPLGTIVFKKLNATRRLSGTMVWERVRNNTPVYEADTLRTAAASEASIKFDDGTNLDMNEYSMLRLNFVGKERVLEFLGGDISVSGPAPEAGAAVAAKPAAYTIAAGDRTITVSSGSAANVSRTGDTLSVAVEAGEVGVTDKGGSTQTLDRTQALEVALTTGTARVVEHTLVPLGPDQNARYLLPRAGSAELEFSWEAHGTGDVSLELSPNKEFDQLTLSVPATGSTVRAVVDPGTWYWRVRAADGTLSSVRRFALYAELPPQPILPAAGTSVLFRTNRPEIHFSWTEMTNATAYLFEIASDPGFTNPVVRTRTNLDNLTVSTLGEGAWYWRVVPVLAMRLAEELPSPEVRSLIITRRADMVALTPTAPLAGSLFLVKEAAAKGISFSWAPNSESVEYELSVSRSSDMRQLVTTRTSTRPWLTLSGADAAPLAQPGSWYWAIRWKDEEGNLSPYSEPRALRGVDGSSGARLTFPPQGYTIADSLIGSTRFAWKSDLPAKTVFQLSDDETFSNVTYEEPCPEGTLIGGQWKSGTWYWRIRTVNVDGSVLTETPARMFRVVDPLEAPRLRDPVAGSMVRLRTEDRYTFAWDAVPGADSYQFALYRIPRGGAATDAGVLQRSEELEDAKIEVPLGSLQGGSYRVQLQAASRDKPSSTRVIGYLGTTEFSFQPLSHVKLSVPPDGALVAGLDAWRHGVTLEWAASDRPESSEVVLARDAALRTAVLRSPLTSGAVPTGRLAAGDYFWTITAKLYGFDISAPRTIRFTVLPIPRLAAPLQLAPAPGGTIGPAQLREASAIRFAWEAVPDATLYLFALFRGNDPAPLIRPSPVTGLGYSVSDLSILDRGEYRWTVTAQSFDARGELEQDGMTAEARFRIDLPSLRAPEPAGKEVFYGR